MTARAGPVAPAQPDRATGPARDYHAIYRATALYEFPFEVRMGLLLAFLAHLRGAGGRRTAGRHGARPRPVPPGVPMTPES